MINVLEFITNTFNTSVMAVTQLLLATVLTSNPWFENVKLDISSTQDELLCSAQLVDNFSASLDNVLLSGETITLHFKYEILASENNTVIHKGEVIHGFRYRVLDDRYYIMRSEKGDLEELFTFDEAKQRYISIQNLGIAPIPIPGGSDSYVLRLTAFLDPVKMSGMTETVNLMLMWVSVKPTYVSEPFSMQVTG